MLHKRNLCIYIQLIIALLSTQIETVQPNEIVCLLSRYSLNRYHQKIYSQSGEDGIVEEIFKRLSIKTGFFVEFGAYDGITMSNTRCLWEKGWSGVMIEPDKDTFVKLKQNYHNDSRVLCINTWVSFKGSSIAGRSFDEIASEFFPYKEIDFLSIDIDGPDYRVFEFLECQPKVICIETGLHWHPLLDIRIPDEFAFQNLHQPLSVMNSIARTKGYTSICFEGGNLFLVRNDFAYLFSEVPQDVLTLWRDGWRNAPGSHEHLINLRATHPIIIRFEGDLNKRYPITKDF